MQKKIEPSDNDSVNWNTGKKFSDIKIMNLLQNADKYEMIAENGFNTLEESMNCINIDERRLDFFKLQAFKYLLSELIQLLRNSKFAIINNKSDAKYYLNCLLIIQNDIFPRIGTFTSKNTAELSKDYQSILKFVQEIKSDINVPLNKNNLIYMNRTDYDPVQAKKSIFIEAGLSEEEVEEE